MRQFPIFICGSHRNLWSVKADWTDVAYDETGYEIQWSMDPGFDPLLGQATLPIGTETYTMRMRAGTHYVRVRALGAGSPSAWVSDSIVVG